MKKMFWVILAFAVWALTMNVIRIANHHGVSRVGLGTIATIGVVTSLRLWREYQKCPICGETDRKKMRVQSVESGNWILWYFDLEGSTLKHCPDPWHVQNHQQKTI